MDTIETSLINLSQVRGAVRRLADTFGLSLETRARLTLSVANVARAALRQGSTVRLRAQSETGDDPAHTGTVIFTLTASPSPDGPYEETPLPLPSRAGGSGERVWRIPLPSAGPGREHRDGDEAAEDEMKAVLARLDYLADGHRQLKDELDETNSGVLALYVQLEERDEQLRHAHGQMLRELEDALRPSPLTVPGLELAVHYAPADIDAPTGGDLYDWFALPDGAVHITVVDALGHGIRSTRSALNTTHTIRTLALEGHHPKDIVRRTSEILEGIDPELMATILIARIDPLTGDVLVANGSHPPPLVVRSTGETEFLEARGRGVGFPYPGSDEVVRTRLDQGELLVFYTDGLTESRRDPHEGEQRLTVSARRHAADAIEEIPGALAREMHTVVLHHDDTLALAVRVTGR